MLRLTVERNRSIDAIAAFLSTLLGLFMGLALFSNVSVLLFPLAPLGLYVGVRVLRSTSGPVRGLAWAGILLNLSITGVLLSIFSLAMIHHLKS